MTFARIDRIGIENAWIIPGKWGSHRSAGKLTTTCRPRIDSSFQIHTYYFLLFTVHKSQYPKVPKSVIHQGQPRNNFPHIPNFSVLRRPYLHFFLSTESFRYVQRTSSRSFSTCSFLFPFPFSILFFLFGFFFLFFFFFFFSLSRSPAYLLFAPFSSNSTPAPDFVVCRPRHQKKMSEWRKKKIALT